VCVCVCVWRVPTPVCTWARVVCVDMRGQHQQGWFICTFRIINVFLFINNSPLKTTNMYMRPSQKGPGNAPLLLCSAAWSGPTLTPRGLYCRMMCVCGLSGRGWEGGWVGIKCRSLPAQIPAWAPASRSWLRTRCSRTALQEKDGRKRQELASSLGISAEEASKLEIGQGTSSMSSAEEEEAIFWAACVHRAASLIPSSA